MEFIDHPAHPITHSNHSLFTRQRILLNSAIPFPYAFSPLHFVTQEDHPPSYTQCDSLPSYSSLDFRHEPESVLALSPPPYSLTIEQSPQLQASETQRDVHIREERSPHCTLRCYRQFMVGLSLSMVVLLLLTLIYWVHWRTHKVGVRIEE